MKLETESVNELGELLFCALYKVHHTWVAGTVSRQAARKLYPTLGVNIEGYRLTLTSNDLVHFIGRHFYDKNRTNEPVTYNDLENVIDIVNHPTSSEPYGSELRIKRVIPRGVAVLGVDINHSKKILIGKTLWILRR